MRRSHLYTAVLVLTSFGLTGLLSAATITVDWSGGGDYTAMQPAIDTAAEGDTVIVIAGTYHENVRLTGRNIVLRGFDPTDGPFVEPTIIDGGSSGTVVTFAGTESSSCTLAGFWIRNGAAPEGSGGGVQGNDAQATIEHCSVTSNRARSGGGIASFRGTIRDCVVRNNNATGDGGGIALCDGAIQNCLIANNVSEEDGGGLDDCDGTIQNNLIRDNSAADEGGGLSGCDGALLNNTIVRNWAGRNGGGIDHCLGLIYNCILHGNDAEVSSTQIDESTRPRHCLIAGWLDEGDGNLTGDPRFVDAATGDFRLQPSSAAVDAGVNFYWWMWPLRDLDGNCRLAGAHVDIGCYESGAGRDGDGDLLADADDAAPAAPDGDGDGLRDGLEILRGSDPATPTPGGSLQVPGDLGTIQAALCLALEGESIGVAPGVYYENVHFCGKDVVLSGYGLTPEEVAATVIDAGGAGPAVTFMGDETPACVLQGLTLRNGRGDHGGGIRGGRSIMHTRAGIEFCVVTGHSVSRGGAGIVWCDGEIHGCTISNNRAANDGAGISQCHGNISHCEIFQNVSAQDGGGLAHCDGPIVNNQITNNTALFGGGIGRCAGPIDLNLISGNIADDEGGGIFNCDARISGNAIRENFAWRGGGLANCDGVIHDNEIAGNTVDNDGGGLALCDATIRENVITSNVADDDGGGAAWCNGLIQNNRFTDNWTLDQGGAAFQCNGTLQNNLIARNTTDNRGGGISACNGAIQNNTIVDNEARAGGAVDRCLSPIRNCVIWGNSRVDGLLDQVEYGTTPTFCCIQDWTGGGVGNIAQDPLFVDAAAGDYRLQAGSPCIDAGVNFYWFAWPQRDLNDNCRLAGARVDMGCHEYGATADADGDLLADAGEAARGTNAALADTDGDGLFDGLEALRGSNPTTPTAPGTIRVPIDMPLIQQALCLALPGDEIVVAPGTYSELINVCGRDVMLRGENIWDPATVAATILDGGRLGPVVFFTGDEGPACRLAGFTIHHGYANDGGGIRGGNAGRHCRATVDHNVVTSNTAAVEGGGLAFCDGAVEANEITSNTADRGGGLAWCQGEIRGNAISGNTARDGGGLAYCDGAIRANDIARNSADDDGGGLFSCNGTIVGNDVIDNWTFNSGGGIYQCNGAILSNRIANNVSADSGGGLYGCDGTVQNNLITSNTALDSGGGLMLCNGTLLNNTIGKNAAGFWGSGLSQCEGMIRNCIVWGNSSAGVTDQLDVSSTPIYSCLQGWTGGGLNNIAEDPLFADPVAGDYRLQAGSPCIDAGIDYYWSAWPQQDAGGACRLAGAAVDIGCHEWGATPDADGDLLADADEAAHGTDANRADTDGDGLRDGLEVLRGSDPRVLTPPEVLSVSAGDVIQRALCLALAGEEVAVAPGVYLENLQFCGLDMTLRGQNPGDPTMVAATNVDGGGLGPVVSFTGAESAQCVLKGLTLQHGFAWEGGGVRGGSPFQSTLATVRQNLITSNTSLSDGGGLAWCDGVIEKNTIAENVAANDGDGGGLAFCDGVIEENTISGNSAGHNGGGLAFCDGVIRANAIVQNWSANDGGGLALCEGLILGNWFGENRSGDDGGAMAHSDATFRNNIVTSNTAADNGGGYFRCSGQIQNETVTYNNAWRRSGGFDRCYGEIQNCIIWGNMLGGGFIPGPQISTRNETPSYSCIQEWPPDENHSIASDPLFFDAEAGDYRLRPGSPCIDAGRSITAMIVGHDGGPRPSDGDRQGAGGTGDGSDFDIGAYEMPPAAPSLAEQIRRRLLGRPLAPSRQERQRFDVNGDGRIDVADLVGAMD